MREGLALSGHLPRHLVQQRKVLFGPELLRESGRGLSAQELHFLGGKGCPSGREQALDRPVEVTEERLRRQLRPDPFDECVNLLRSQLELIERAGPPVAAKPLVRFAEHLLLDGSAESNSAIGVRQPIDHLEHLLYLGGLEAYPP